MTQPTYNNTSCDRCGTPKETGTPTLWCDACDALPCCEECGEPVEDCDAGKGGWPCCGDSGCMSDYEERMHERRQMGLVNF